MAASAPVSFAAAVLLVLILLCYCRGEAFSGGAAASGRPPADLAGHFAATGGRVGSRVVHSSDLPPAAVYGAPLPPRSRRTAARRPPARLGDAYDRTALAPAALEEWSGPAGLWVRRGALGRYDGTFGGSFDRTYTAPARLGDAGAYGWLGGGPEAGGPLAAGARGGPAGSRLKRYGWH